jgi:hypothetical protein
MKEGFWLNSNNYKYAGIDDHAMKQETCRFSSRTPRL